jgi:Holliday junction resolvase RusA-like endonuclease
MVFTLKPPQRMPKGRTRPTCYPDLSKLIRATEDALTGLAWGDDAQVVEYRDTVKTYPGGHRDALDSPGAVIRIWQIGGMS